MTSELKTALGYECWVAEGPVLLDYADHVATLTLNRPESSNGMNIAMMQAIHEAVMRCHGDPRVRVVHVRGAGANFCAGGDVREFASKGEALGDFLRTVTAYLQMAVGGLIRLNATVVSEVQGYAAGGGGLGLVCASDLVVAAKSARFMAGATRVGMAPDGGASVILPRLVGFRRAAEIVLTNRVLGAEEAQAIGLINSIVPDDGLAERRASSSGGWPPTLPGRVRPPSGCSGAGSASASSPAFPRRRGRWQSCRPPLMREKVWRPCLKSARRILPELDRRCREGACTGLS